MIENDLAQNIKGPHIVSDGPPKRPGPPIERRSWETPPMIIRLKFFRSPHYNGGGGGNHGGPICSIQGNTRESRELQIKILNNPLGQFYRATPHSKAKCTRSIEPNETIIAIYHMFYQKGKREEPYIPKRIYYVYKTYTIHISKKNIEDLR